MDPSSFSVTTVVSGTSITPDANSYVLGAQKVTWTGNTATVVTADATNDQIFASVNAGGEVEVNLEDFHEEKGAYQLDGVFVVFAAPDKAKV